MGGQHGLNMKLEGVSAQYAAVAWPFAIARLVFFMGLVSLWTPFLNETRSWAAVRFSSGCQHSGARSCSRGD